MESDKRMVINKHYSLAYNCPRSEGKYITFWLGKPIYKTGFIKVRDLSSFHNILYHHSFLIPSYTTDLNELVTAWLLNDRLQCNSILLIYGLPTFLKNPYKPCVVLVKINMLHLVVWGQNQIKILCLCQNNRERSKVLSLRALVEMLNTLLVVDIQFQGPKPKCSEISDEREEEILSMNPSNHESDPWWRPKCKKKFSIIPCSLLANQV